jgi:hypothetical protein
MRGNWWLLTVVLMAVAMPLSAAMKPIWGRGATTFAKECPRSRTACTLAYLSSPNKKLSITIRLNGYVPTFTLKDGNRTFDLPLEYWVDTDVLWSPDSSAFSLTGNPNGYTNQTRLYRITPAGPKLVDIASVMREMGSTYPPCVGMPDPADVDFCNSIRDGSGYNYATFAWTGGHTAVLMAEVVPTGSYGKFLGQIRGYEFDVATGAIVRVMDAKELQRRWQYRMAWKLQIPEKP